MSKVHHNTTKARKTAIEILKVVTEADGEATIQTLMSSGYSRFQIKQLINKQQIRVSGKVDTGMRGRPKMKFMIASKGRQRLAKVSK